MLPLELVIPATVSLIITLAAHIVSLVINRSKNNTTKDIRGVSVLENQLTTTLSENEKLKEQLRLKETQADELRDLKYTLDFKLLTMENEIKALRNTIKNLKEENFQLKSQIAMFRNQTD